MPRRLFIALILLVAAPVVLLAWVSATTAKANERAARESLSSLLASQLRDADRRVGLVFQGYTEVLDSNLLEAESKTLRYDPAAELIESLRRMRRDVPIVRQGILIDSQGRVLFPLPRDLVGEDAREVAAALPGLVDARPFSRSPPNPSTVDPDVQRSMQIGTLPGRAFLREETVQQLASPVPVQREPLPQSSNLSQQIPLQQRALPRPEFDHAPAVPVVQRQQDSAAFPGDLAATVSLSGNDSISRLSVVPLERGQKREPAQRSAWQQWYLADGAQVVYWRMLSDGRMAGVILERSRWIADLIAVLPENSAFSKNDSDGEIRRQSLAKDFPVESTPIGTVSLVDEAKRVVYQWGEGSQPGADPLVSTALSIPLASWQFRLFVDPQLLPSANHWPTGLALGAIALLLLAIGVYVLTAVQRQIAQASSRVSFAGQVSHELRTPLTNIRLYTELAESDLEKIDEGETRQSLRRRLDVIDHESRRLQRLVSGVLEMIRPSGRRAGVRRQPTDVDELLSGVIEQFRPSFQVAGIDLEKRCDLRGCYSIDPDVVETVLVNLLSNVEKYVPHGGHCTVSARIDQSESGRVLRLAVDDDGPGIGVMNRVKIFRPFVRLDDSINAPSGTGIGLTIAQRVALRHDGELKLIATSELGGAAFELSLPLPPEA